MTCDIDAAVLFHETTVSLILVIIKDGISVFLNQSVSLCSLEIFFGHLSYEFVKRHRWFPAEFLARFRRVTEKRLHFGRSIVSGIDGDDDTSLLINALFLRPDTLPGKLHAQLTGRQLNEFPYTVLLAGSNHVISGLALLEHAPLHLYVIARMAPIAQSIQIPHIEPILQTHLDTSQSARDLSRHKRLAAIGRFMVEQNAIARIHAPRFSIVDRDPVRIELSHSIG